MQIRLTFFDVVLFAIMIIGFVIGIHQSIYYGVANSYWLFMLSSLAFLWLNQRGESFSIFFIKHFSNTRTYSHSIKIV